MNKKIFLISPTLQQGGAERVISELANQFCKYDGVTIHLVLLAISDDFYSINDKVIIHRLGFENKGKVQKKISEIKTLFQLRNLYRHHKPNSVLSFQERFNSFAILASIGTRIPVFVSDRSNPLKLLSPFNEKLRRFTYKYAAGIISQTSFAKEIIEKKIKNKNIKVIPNPIKEITTYPEIKREKIILNVGRLVPEKGQKYLIEAFTKLDNKEWKLFLLGEGPLLKELQSQVVNLGKSDQVEFKGAVTNVDEYLARASIFAFPSISEGFPNALIEAMGAGLPCVSFDCNAGPRDVIVDGENGFLIELNNTVELHDKLNLLTHESELRTEIGKQAIKQKEVYNLDVIASQFYDFITSK